MNLKGAQIERECCEYDLWLYNSQWAMQVVDQPLAPATIHTLSLALPANFRLAMQCLIASNFMLNSTTAGSIIAI